MMMRKTTCTTTASIATFSLALTLFVAPVMSHANEKEPKMEPARLGPSKRYSGATPIDLDNGAPFNNGTFGLPNAEYEAWSQPPFTAVGLNAKTYPYADKAHFVSVIEDRLDFYEAALTNWGHTRATDAKPEVVEYAKQATQAIQPKLEAARKALGSAKSAGSNDWTKAEADARQAYVELQGTYATLHMNVR
jgi:hypothetical protein